MKRIILFTIMMLVMIGSVIGASITLYPIEDTSVLGDNPTLNRGAVDWLYATGMDTGVSHRESYAKFNLTSLPPLIVTSATYEIYVRSVTDSGWPLSSRAYGNTSLQEWDELIPTWNDRLGFNDSLRSENNITWGSAPTGYQSFQVSAILNASLNNSNDNVTIFTKSYSSGGDISVQFYANEYSSASRRPRLVIVYELVPECNPVDTCCDGSGFYVAAGTDPEGDCTAAGWDGCAGSGTPYKCEKTTSNTGDCNGAGACETDQTNVISGSVCDGGAEVVGSDTFYSSTCIAS